MGGDKHVMGRNSRHPQHTDEQSAFIFAISILVFENLLGRGWLIARLSKVYGDISYLLLYKVEEDLHFVLSAVESFGQLLYLPLDGLIGLRLPIAQAPPPGKKYVPVIVGRCENIEDELAFRRNQSPLTQNLRNISELPKVDFPI